jgi:hypothetical protein
MLTITDLYDQPFSFLNFSTLGGASACGSEIFTSFTITCDVLFSQIPKHPSEGTIVT